MPKKILKKHKGTSVREEFLNAKDRAAWLFDQLVAFGFFRSPDTPRTVIDQIVNEGAPPAKSAARISLTENELNAIVARAMEMAREEAKEGKKK